MDDKPWETKPLAWRRQKHYEGNWPVCRHEVLNFAVFFFSGGQQARDRARSGRCSNALLGTSSLDGALGGRDQRSMKKTGVGSCVGSAVLCEMKDLGITFPSWQVLSMSSGRFISMQRYVPRIHQKKTLMRHARGLNKP